MDAVFQTIQDARETRPVPREFYPLLVTFGNLGNPASVREVKPSDLAASFGPGFALKSITLEITDEPVTEGRVESVLPWAPSLQGSIGKGMKLKYDDLLNRINDGSFIQGMRP
ncbi:MAG: hypothetical protein HYX36_06770 [Rhizobiales bacterium]|nr:hypothetical protein [Hyphomicrobiales bacterium]